MPDQLTITLHDGDHIPQIGLGVWQTPQNIAGETVRLALDCGYRHIDTASAYENERGVGEGMREAGLARGEVFVTTKVWNSAHGFDTTLRACDESLRLLGLDSVDFYLIYISSIGRRRPRVCSSRPGGRSSASGRTARRGRSGFPTSRWSSSTASSARQSVVVSGRSGPIWFVKNLI